MTAADTPEIGQEREEFEAWATSTGSYVSRNISGEYSHMSTQWRWESWQAARALSQEAEQEMLAALEHVRSIIKDAALTGFNHADGDWAERLFASQQVTAAALAKARATGGAK